MSERKQPGIGVAIIVKDLQKDRILLMKRKGSKGEGTWAFPGGHLEIGETLSKCVIREAKEELGIDVKGCIRNDMFEDIMEDRHYLTFYYSVISYEGEPQIKEPDKCEELRFFHIDELPTPLFDITQNWVNEFNKTRAAY